MYNATWLDEDYVFDYDYYNNFSYIDIEYPETSTNYRFVVLMIEVILGLILNAIAIAVIYRGKNVGPYMRMPLLNVAVSDLLFCCIVVFSEHLINTNRFIHTTSLCRFFWLVVNGILDSTLIWRMTISVNWCYRLSSRNRNAVYSIGFKIAITVAVWITSFVVPLYYVITAEAYNFVEDDGTTHSFCHTGISPWGLFVTSLVHVLLPMILIIMYCVIMSRLHRLPVYTQMESQETGLDIQTRQAINMIVVDGVVFLFTWLPIHVLTFLLSVGLDTWSIHHSWFYIFTSLHIILMLKCFDTPIIYYATNPLFRKDTHALFLSCCRRRNAGEGSTDQYQLVEAQSHNSPTAHASVM